MNRLSRVAVLLSVAVGALMPVTPAPAQADLIGGLIVIPGTGSDLTAMRLRTSAGCPTEAKAFYAKMRGHGFPADGQVITANTKAGMSHTIGFDAYVALIMRDYATENRTTLAGRYDITAYCVNRTGQQSYGEFTGALEFTSPTTYQAIGAARPTGPPPEPRTLAGDGSALDPNASAPPVGALQSSRLSSQAGQGAVVAPSARPFSGIGAQPQSGADPQSPSTAGQLTSQRSDVTDQSAWLIAVLIGAVLVGFGLVAIVMSRIRKRRSS
jgi:hypothetical protein